MGLTRRREPGPADHPPWRARGPLTYPTWSPAPVKHHVPRPGRRRPERLRTGPRGRLSGLAARRRHPRTAVTLRCRHHGSWSRPKRGGSRLLPTKNESARRRAVRPRPTSGRPTQQGLARPTPLRERPRSPGTPPGSELSSERLPATAARRPTRRRPRAAAQAQPPQRRPLRGWSTSPTAGSLPTGGRRSKREQGWRHARSRCSPTPASAPSPAGRTRSVHQVARRGRRPRRPAAPSSGTRRRPGWAGPVLGRPPAFLIRRRGRRREVPFPPAGRRESRRGSRRPQPPWPAAPGTPPEVPRPESSTARRWDPARLHAGQPARSQRAEVVPSCR